MYLKKLFILLLILPILLLTMLGCGSSQEPESIPTPPPEQPVVPPTASSAPTGPMKAQLSMSDLPLIGKPVQLTATISIREGSDKDIPNTSVELILPEGFELVGGNLTGTVDVMRGNPAQLQATVKAVKTGHWKIQVRASYYHPAFVAGLAGTGVDLYALVSEDIAEVSDVPLWPKLPEQINKEVPPAPPPPSFGQPKSSSFSPESGEKSFTDELRIYGGFKCWISENSLPSAGDPRNDEKKEIVWGGVYVFNAQSYQQLAIGLTVNKHRFNIGMPLARGISIIRRSVNDREDRNCGRLNNWEVER